MSYKISSFIIGLIIFSAIVSIFGIFVANIGTIYAPADYSENNETLAAYSKLNELSSQTEDIKNSTSDIKEKTGVLDVVGSFFTDSYRTLLITKSSFDTFDSMSNTAFTDSGLGESGRILKIALTTIILICIFVGVLLSALVKKDL